MKLPKIVNSILCEDIRMEFSGKFSLAGVFGSDMTALDLSGPIIGGVFAEMDPSHIGIAEAEFRVIDAANVELIKLTIPLNIQTTERQPLILGPFNFTVTTTGEVKFQWRTADSRWTTIKAFNVRPPQDAASPNSPQKLFEELFRKASEIASGTPQ